MQYIDPSDDEILSLINETEDAKDILFDKYGYIIDILIRKYIKMANNLGIEYRDLYQDALVGFVDAINRYQPDKDASIATFITICVERKLQVTLIKAGRIKNKVLNEALSLEHSYDIFKQPLMYILSDNNKHNPLENIVNEEEFKELLSNINNVLSENEKEVYNLMKNNLNYQEIATLLGKNPKQIDNSIQRIKIKIKRLIEERKGE